MEPESALARNPSAFLALSFAVLAAGLLIFTPAFAFPWDTIVPTAVAPLVSLFALGYTAAGWRREPKWATRAAFAVLTAAWLYGFLHFFLALRSLPPAGQ
jgi:hypothetical protein